MLERNERLWRVAGLVGVHVPTVSLFSGKRSARLFDEILGDFEIEDFWLPYFCTTVDLSAFHLVVHRSGPSGQWVRASATVAGLWPPVVDERGHLHIDGGQLNNLPTDQMRVRHAGPIIAVDVFSRQAEMTLSLERRHRSASAISSTVDVRPATRRSSTRSTAVRCSGVSPNRRTAGGTPTATSHPISPDRLSSVRPIRRQPTSGTARRWRSCRTGRQN